MKKSARQSICDAVIADPRLRGLKPVLLDWGRCVTEFCRHEGVPPYYVISAESANAALLTGALWRTGAIALQEVQTPKGGKKGPGRVDIWLRRGNLRCHVEVKMHWAYKDLLQSPIASEAEMKRRLAVAVREASKYRVGSGSLKLGLLAVVPGVHPDTWKKAKTRVEYLEAFISMVRWLGESEGLVAWCLPRGTARWDGCRSDPQYEEYYYPAVALVGAVAGKSVKHKS